VAHIAKFIKSLRVRWYGHTEMINNDRIPKEIVTARIKEIRKRKTMERIDC
jgi:hypothetical protein